MKFSRLLSLLLSMSICMLTNTSAQNYIVNSNGDTHASNLVTGTDAGGNITLRSAIEAATAQPGSHTITFAAPVTSINLTLGQIPVGNAAAGHTITINGPGMAGLSVNQTTVDRVFITGTGAISFSISGMTINFASGAAGTITGGGGAILAGGGGAVTTLTNVAINDFDIQEGNGGAISASAPTSSHTLTITGCTFSNNSCGGAGGAVNYDGLGTVTITSSTFTGNRTMPLGINTGGDGGALNTTGTGAGGTYTVTGCHFLNNQVLNITAHGGAVSNVNGDMTLQYCRLINNTAALATNGNVLWQVGGLASSSFNADNNWWGQNDGPTANDVVKGPAPVTASIFTKWLQLKTSASPATICPTATGPGNSTLVTTSFLENSAGEPISVANLGVLIGLPVSWTATLGSLSGQQSSIQSNGTATATFTSNGTPGTATVNAVVDNVAANDPIAGVNINVNTPASIGAAGQPANQDICGAGTAVFTVTPSGTGPFTYQWYFGANPLSDGALGTATVSGSATDVLTITNATPAQNGAYHVVVSNLCGTATSNNATLTVYTPPVINTVSVTQPTCAVPTGTIVINASGSLTLEYSVNNGSSYQLSNSFASLAPGNYQVRVRLQGTSCHTEYLSNPVTINASAGMPVVSAPTVTQPTCANPTGTITVNATGSGPLEYSIDGGSSWHLSNSFGGLAPGNYFVRARLLADITCNTAYASNPVVIDPVPAPPTINTPTVTQPTCAIPTGTIVVNATGSGMLEYSLNGGPWQSSNSFSNLAPGNYLISARQQNDPTCFNTYSGNPVVINGAGTAPLVNAPTVTQPSCAIGTGTIVVNASGAGPLEYSVDGGTNWQPGNVFAGLVPGNYNIVVRLQNDITCVTSYSGNPVTIDNIPAAPVVTAPGITQPTCAVMSGTIVVNATASVAMEYSVDNGSNWQSGNVFSGLAPGAYNIVVRLQSNPSCSTVYANNPVIIDPVPSFPVVNAPTLIQPTCAVPSGTITVNATGSGPLEYSIDGGSNWQSSNIFSGLAPGNYNISVRVQSSTACATSYSGNPVMINSIPVAPVVNPPTVTQPVCAVPTGTIVVNATGNGTLEYSIDGGSTWQASNTFSGLAPGNYNIAVRLLADATCMTTYAGNPVTIDPSPLPVVNDPADQVVCNSGATNAVVFTGSTVTGTVYNWTNTEPSIGLAASGSGDIASFVAVNSGTTPIVATITVTPVAFACTGTPQSFTITVNPTPTVNAIANQGVCNGSPTTAVTITGNIPGTVFNWTNSNTSIGLAANGTGNISSFNAINTGNTPVTATITVTPSYSNAAVTCTGTPVSFTITVNPTPTVGSIPSQTVCNGAPTTAVNFTGAVAGTVYNWTNSNPSIGLAASGSGNIASFNAINSGLNPVTATITVIPVYTNAGATCSGSATSFNITVNPTPTVACPSNITVNNTPGQCGTIVNYPAAIATGTPAPTITYSMPSGSFFPVGTTTVTVTATNICGTASCTFTVTVNDTELPVITCPANITVSSTPGLCTAPVTYSVTAADNCPGVTTMLVSGLASGANFPVGTTTVTYTATDASGNSSTCSFTVTVIDSQLPVIGTQPVNTARCAGDDAIFSVVATNATGYQWQTFNGSAWVNIPGATASTLTINNVSSAMNTNTFRVNVIGLCTTVTSQSATLIVNPLPSLSINATPPPLLMPSEFTTLTATVNPPGGTFVWTLNGSVIAGATGASIVAGIDDLGSYVATYTDHNGCSSTSNVIDVLAEPTSNLWVYPNPNSGQFNVRFYNGTSIPAALVVYDSRGAEVYRKNVTPAVPYTLITVDMPKEAAGMYLVVLVDQGGNRLGAKQILIRR